MPNIYIEETNNNVRVNDVRVSIKIAENIVIGSGSSTLAQLTDVNLSSPTNNQVLSYNSSTSKWVNSTQSGGYSGTPGSVLFLNTDGTITEDNTKLFWDDTNNRLCIGTNTSVHPLTVIGKGTFTDTYTAPVNDNDHFLTLWPVVTSAGSSTDIRAISIDSELTGSVDAAAVRAMRGRAMTSATSSANVGTIQGISQSQTHQGSGLVDFMSAYQGSMNLWGSGNATLVEYFRTNTPNLTSTGRIVGLTKGLAVYDIGTSNSTGVYGAWVDDLTKPTSAEAYAYWTQIAAGSGGKYAFYGAGDAPSYFNGNVGIGNTSPSARLSINTSTSQFNVLSDGRVQVGHYDTNNENPFDVQYTMSTNPFSANRYFVRSTATVALTGSTAYGYGAILGKLTTSGSGTYPLLEGVYGYTSIAGAATVTRAMGGRLISYHDGSGVVTHNHGTVMSTGTRSTGNITNNYGLLINTPEITSSGNITGANYGLYIEDQNVGGGSKYSIYAAGSASSYLAGNVGIATLPTSAKLEIGGATVIKGSSLGAGSYLQVKNDSSSIAIIGSDAAISAGTASDVGFYVYGANHLDFWTNSTRSMRLTSGGRLGIGTGTSAVAEALSIYFANPYVSIDSSNSGNGGIKLLKASTETWRIDNVAADNRLRFLAGVTTEALSISSAGNVGVGQTTPSGKLHVLGSIGTAPANNTLTTLRLESSATAGVGVGPSLLFRGKTGNSTAEYGFAGIMGAKESATASNYDGYLSFFVQSGSAAALTEVGRFTSAGNLGIGVTSPSYKLDVLGNVRIGTDNAEAHLVFKRAGYSYVQAPASGSIGFVTNNRVISDANSNLVLHTDGKSYFNVGNVGIGNTAPDYPLTVGATTAALLAIATGAPIAAASSTSSLIYAAECRTASSSGGGAFFLGYANDGAAMASGDRLGGLLFGGSSAASQLRNTAGIVAYASAAWTEGSSYPSHFTFETVSVGSTARTEKMRITASGNIGIGTTNPNELLEIASTSSTGGRFIISDSGGTSRKGVLFASPSSTLNFGRIEAYNYGSSSGMPLVLNNIGGGNVGIATSAPDKALEINSATGNNLRLTYNDADGSATNYVDFSVSSSGDLTVAPSGSDLNVTGRLTPSLGVVSRVISQADDSTAVIDVTATDVYELTAMANATTFSTTGTPVDGQKIIIRFKDNGSARGLTWNGIFRAIGVTLPTTTTASKQHYVDCIYNSNASKFDVLAVRVEA